MDINDLEPGAFFTTNGKDIWKMLSCCKGPSCTMQDIETSKKTDFGIDGLTAKTFHRIKMPKLKKDKNE